MNILPRHLADRLEQVADDPDAVRAVAAELRAYAERAEAEEPPPAVGPRTPRGR